MWDVISNTETKFKKKQAKNNKQFIHTLRPILGNITSSTQCIFGLVFLKVTVKWRI